jgi:hypothetical protein
MFNATIVGNVVNDTIDIVTEKGRSGKNYHYTTIVIDTGKYYGKNTLIHVRCYGALADNCKTFLKRGSIVCFSTEVTSSKNDPDKLMFTAMNTRFFTDYAEQNKQDEHTVESLEMYDDLELPELPF